MEPARSIIKRLGGASKVAAAAGVHRTRVYSWMSPKSAGGSDGRIPLNHWEPLLVFAAGKGISLELADFMPKRAAEVAE